MLARIFVSLIIFMGGHAIAASPMETKTSTTQPSPPDSLQLVPQLSILSPTHLVLSNDGYVVPYSGRLSGLPAMELGIGAMLGSLGPIQFQSLTRTGYGFKEALVGVQPRGGEAQNIFMSLHWIPFTEAIRAYYRIPGVGFIRPTLEVGGGMQWFHQSGNLPGLSGGFWVPLVFVTPALTLLEGNPTDDWFGGLTFGTSLQQSISPSQTMNGWSFELSMNVFL